MTESINKFLEANKNKTVKTIQAELMNLIFQELSKKQSHKSANKRDKDGNVLEIKCYFHDKWEKLSEHEYGIKKNSTTGFNTMCKLGNRGWNARQKRIDAIDTVILQELVDGEITRANVPARKLVIKADIIAEFSVLYGYGSGK